jgi:NAD(P)-dependent dehydrogenase (short-subunit alcohol dehydrogenase family)
MSTIFNPFSLEGKRILVTGASSGIGQETAIQCSKLGATLIIAGRNIERLEDTFSRLEGDGHSMSVFDQIDEQQVNEAISTMEEVDGIVLCAGRGMTKPLVFCKSETYEEVFNTNFFSTVNILRLLVKQKKVRKNASIVFVSSIGGVYSFNPGNGVYGASKAALNSAMKFFARELASKTIRVNSVNPGMVKTPFIGKGSITEEQMQQDCEKYPLKRYGEPSDIAFGIIYLLSDASSWITGQSLVIDGGVTI